MKAETMKYRVLCHILVFLLCVGGLSAQTVVKDSAQMAQSTQASVQAHKNLIARNIISLELLGTGFLYSINYERFLTEEISLRVGIGSLPWLLTVPITINRFVRQDEHTYELGLSHVLGWSQGSIYSPPQFIYTPYIGLRLGYRFQPLEGGWTFGVSFTPNFSYPLHQFGSFSFSGFAGGISLGWGF